MVSVFLGVELDIKLGLGFDPFHDAQVPGGRSRLTHGRTSVTFMCSMKPGQPSKEA